MTVIRIATRGSDLALAQARYVAGRIERELGCEPEIVVVKTTGDRIQNVSLAKIGGKGLFVKEIEESLLENRADVAVHSAKDLPAGLADGLELAAFPQREDCRDALVGRRSGTTLAGLRKGARVGTGSARRGALLLAGRPDLEIVPLRGNVPTRLRKIEADDLDAVVLACAGLDRLGFGDRIDERLSPDVMLPAVAQGALALEARRGDPIAEAIAALDDAQAAVSVAAERGFLVGVGGDCNTPLACLAEHTAGGTMRVRALLASPRGEEVVRDEAEVQIESAAAGGAGDIAAAAGAKLAERILAAGGAALLARLRDESEHE